MANLQRDITKRPQAWRPEDFYEPSWYKKEEVEPEKLTDEEKEKVISKFPKTLPIK